MNRILKIAGFVTMASLFSTGCAGNAQCLRDREALQAQVYTQQVELRDADARLLVESSAKTGDDLSALARDGWEAAMSAWAWTKNEAPVAARQAQSAYQQVSAQVTRAHQCYADHGGNRPGLTFDDYKRIASACLNGN